MLNVSVESTPDPLVVKLTIPPDDTLVIVIVKSFAGDVGNVGPELSTPIVVPSIVIVSPML